MTSEETLVIAGIILIFVGVMLVFIGSLAGVFSGGKTGKAEAGGVVLIGPIPIIFGTSWRAAVIASILAIILLVLALVLMRRIIP